MPDAKLVPYGPRRPRHDETDKGVIERAIFAEFSARYRPDIDRVSIRSGAPQAREPDIIAKSTESDLVVACELVRLTEDANQALVRATSGTTQTPASGQMGAMSIDAFTRKFEKARHGLYDGVRPGQLELLAYSDHLATPWPQVLKALTHWLQAAPRDGFTRVWLWDRASGTTETELWVWEAAGNIRRFA